MTDIAALGIQIDSKPAVSAGDALDDFALAAGRAEDAAQDLGAAASKAGKPLAGVGKGMGSVAYQSRYMAQQLSQVAQQTMASGNFIQALAIQLPDLAGNFGAVGIAAGVLAGIALPLVASLFMETGDEAERAKDILEATAKAVDTFVASSQAAAAPMEDLVETYGRMADEAQRALQALAAADQLEAMQAIQAQIDLLADSLLKTVTAREALAAGTGTRQLVDDFGMLASNARAFEKALADLQGASSLDQQADAAMRVMNALDDARDAAGNLPPPLQEAYDAAAAIVPEVAKVNNQVDQLAGLLRLAAGAADSASAAVSGIGKAASGAYGAVSSLVAKMWEMGQARAAYSKSVGGGRGLGRGGPELDPYGYRAQLERDSKWKPPSSGAGSGGGGGGGVEPGRCPSQP